MIVGDMPGTELATRPRPQGAPGILLQLLVHGRREIEEGRIVPAVDVFAQIEAMDKEDLE